MARLWLEKLGSALSDAVGREDSERNRESLSALNAAVAEKIELAKEGWGESYKDRVHAKGKWTTWERIEALKDEGSRVYPMGSLVNWGRAFPGSKREAPGAGVVTAFVRVHGLSLIHI